MFGIPVSGGYCDVQWEITFSAVGVASMGFAVGNHLGSWVQSYMLRMAEREKDWLRQELEHRRENDKRLADAIEGLTGAITEVLKVAAEDRQRAAEDRKEMREALAREWDRVDEERRMAAKERDRADEERRILLQGIKTLLERNASNATPINQSGQPDQSSQPNQSDQPGQPDQPAPGSDPERC